MSTRNVVLTPHHEQIIDTLVKSGRYQNASEVMRDGLRLVERREAREEARLKALRAAVQVGLDDIDAGRYIDLTDDRLDTFIESLGNDSPPEQGSVAE